MINEILGLLMLISLLGGIFIGFPIAFTLIILSVVFGYIGFGPVVFYLMNYQTLGVMQAEVLAAAPLFIFMGYILQHAKLMERLFKGLQLLLAPLNGALYLCVLVTSAIFATATGIIGASVTLMGIMAAPQMMKSGYDVRLSAGTITAGGTLGILIPPSIMLVLLGPVMGVSVVDLFAACLLPGLLLTTLYIVYTMVRCYINPALGPALAHHKRAKSMWHILEELFFGIIPIGTVVFAALGSILMGIATPTEAAGVAAFAALVLCGLYGRLNTALVKNAVLSTLETSSMVLFLAVASNIFGAVFAKLGTGDRVTEIILSLSLPSSVMIVLINVFIFLLGWPLEWPTIVLVFVPIFLPILKSLQVDLLWFSVLIATNLQTAFLSPPVALSAYYLKAVAKDWSLKDINWGMAEFMVLQLIGLILIMIFPQLALWLPSIIR